MVKNSDELQSFRDAIIGRRFGTYRVSTLIHTAKALRTYHEESGTSPGQDIHRLEPHHFSAVRGYNACA